MSRSRPCRRPGSRNEPRRRKHAAYLRSATRSNGRTPRRRSSCWTPAACGARINEIRGLGQQPAIHGSLGICARPLEGDDQNDNYRVTLLRTVVEAGADRAAKNASGETAIEVATKGLAG